MMRVLAVDDDPKLRNLLHQYLEEAGFDVMSASNGQEMKAHLATHTFDLVMLDILLPGEDGLSLAQGLLSEYSMPIIILSAKNEDMDRIIGLELGADDYITKPFNPRELIARIRAVLRRKERSDNNHATPPPQTPVYRFGLFTLDTATHKLYRNDCSISLTNGEYELLYIFIQNCNKVLNRDLLMDLLNRHEHIPFDRSIDVRVSRLRLKIEDDPSDPEYIQTIWGEGYLFSALAEIE